MPTYRITSSAGVTLGQWQGDEPGDALDAMAREAGYEDQADAERQCGQPFDGTVEEVSRG